MQIYADNKKACFDYEILETLEAGPVLSGHEVKAVKSGKASIKGSYGKILRDEAWLVGAVISPYQQGNTPLDYDQQKSRKLLLNKKEIKYLTGKSQERGLTLVPIKLYNKNGLVKLEIGVGRGKKKSDKRESIKKQDVNRQIQRELKS